MATVTTSTNLDVTEKFRALLAESMGSDSAYIRAKETIQELVSNGALADAEKAEVLSNIVSSMVNNLTSASMSTAISWAQAEKDLELRKLELGRQLDILDNDALLKEAQVDQISTQTRLAKVESKRMFGTAVFDGSGNIASLGDDGKVAKDIELLESQRLKVIEEQELVKQKVKESHAAVHKIVADTYVNFGTYSYNGLSENGISAIAATHGDFKTLSDTQQDIAIEQAKGYSYNAWANALTGSASMLGTAIAAEYAEFGAGQPGGILLDTVLDAARNLKNATTTTSEAVPVD